MYEQGTRLVQKYYLEWFTPLAIMRGSNEA